MLATSILIFERFAVIVKIFQNIQTPEKPQDSADFDEVSARLELAALFPLEDGCAADPESFGVLFNGQKLYGFWTVHMVT